MCSTRTIRVVQLYSDECVVHVRSVLYNCNLINLHVLSVLLLLPLSIATFNFPPTAKFIELDIIIHIFHIYIRQFVRPSRPHPPLLLFPPRDMIPLLSTAEPWPGADPRLPNTSSLLGDHPQQPLTLVENLDLRPSLLPTLPESPLIYSPPNPLHPPQTPILR